MILHHFRDFKDREDFTKCAKGKALLPKKGVLIFFKEMKFDL